MFIGLIAVWRGANNSIQFFTLSNIYKAGCPACKTGNNSVFPMKEDVFLLGKAARTEEEALRLPDEGTRLVEECVRPMAEAVRSLGKGVRPQGKGVRSTGERTRPMAEATRPVKECIFAACAQLKKPGH